MVVTVPPEPLLGSGAENHRAIRTNDRILERAIALSNKLAHIAWAVLTHSRELSTEDRAGCGA
jgi:hypothetical protein